MKHLAEVDFANLIRVKRNGGVKESRTPDLRIANATLYQLSYDPTHANATDPCREGQA